MTKFKLPRALQYALVPIVALALTGVAIFVGDEANSGLLKQSNPDEYLEYLSAFTSGEISKKSTIKVRFVDQIAEVEDLEETASSPFKFKPGIDGECKWLDTRTIEFTPEQALESGKAYQGRIDLSEYLEDVPDSLKYFHFTFSTIPQSFEITYNGFELIDKNALKSYQFKGQLITADYESKENIESVLEASIDNSDQTIEWKHDTTGHIHDFKISNIERKEKAQELVFNWDGKEIGFEENGSEQFTLRSLSDFNYTRILTYNSPEQFVEIEFSDPLKKNQDLKGLISLGGKSFDYLIVGNKLQVYPKKRIAGSTNLKIEAGIINALDYKTKTEIKKSISFVQLKPQVRLVGSKAIVPIQGGKVPFVFEAVSLEAVDVRIIQVFEKNVGQFLQVNQLDQHNELQRVGKILFYDKVKLDNKNELNLENWNKHMIDISKYVDTDPGAIYEVAIGFRKSYSLYRCSEEVEDDDDDENYYYYGNQPQIDESVDREMLATPGWDKPKNNESSYWDGYYYRYRDRENPCKQAYYSKNRAIKKNILATNIALLAKKGTNGEMILCASDINSADGLENVSFEVYDYQQDLLGTATSGLDGMAKLKIDKRPFLLVAKNGKQRGYLRLNDGNAVSMSRFDVSGVRKFKGLNGFFYGERGVWRPGDSLFLTFMLEDKNGILPDNHPVKLKLINPQDQVVDQRILTSSLNGFYGFNTATKEDAGTGNYRVEAHVGGTKFSKSLKIETIVPNRLKINLEFDEDELKTGKPNPVKLNSKWLHGAPASSLKADVTVNLSPTQTKFKKFSEFSFDDPSARFEADSEVLFKGQLDEEGNATFEGEPNFNGTSAGKLMATFKTKVFEKSGNFSVDQYSVPFHPYPYYVGVRMPKGDNKRNMLLTDTNHTVQLVSLNPDGSPAQGKKLKIKVYHLRWRWWWDENNNEVSYNVAQNRSSIRQGTVVTNSKGEANWNLKVNYPSWGRYLIRIESEDGHSTGKVFYMDWPGWAGKPKRDMAGGANMLTFETDKNEYTIGDEINLNIPSTKGSRMLISIENSTRVIDAFWKDGQEDATKVKISATAAMAPNAYVSVTLVNPHKNSKTDAPLRVYGIVPIKVIDPHTKLAPTLKMPDVLRPNKDVSITVGEKDGKAMTYTLAIVDEGLLDLTRFKTPDPWSHFYKKEALGVQTWDVYDEILSANNMFANSLLAIGGGEGMQKNNGGKKQNRFKPLVKFIGPFHLNDGETKTHKIKLPNYVGSARTMVVAGFDGAYGYTDKTTQVKEDLMVLGTLPRVLGPGEELDLPVTIFNMSSKIKSVDIKVTGSNLITIDGETSKNISTSKQGEYMVNFKLKTKKKVGVGKVKISVTGGGKKAVWFTDIDVRTPNPLVIDNYDKTLLGNSKHVFEFDPVGLNGTNKATLEVSSMPPINLGKRLDYLIRYPYGCVEQTTSSVFPQLHLSKLMKLSSKRTKRIEKNVKAGIARLSTFQTSGGGLSYWPGNSHPNEWGTNYAGHFMIEAEAAGYKLPANFKSKWISFQKSKANNFSTSNNRGYKTQAYRLYLLAKAGKPEMGAMNRLRQKSNLPVIAKWHLAGAYSLSGQNKLAKDMVKSLPTAVSDYQELGGSYGSSLRDQGIVLEVLTLLKNESKAADVAKSIANKLNTQNWYSTQTTAYCLISIANFVDGPQGSEMSFEYRVNGGEWKPAKSANPIWQYEYTISGESAQKIELRNKNGKTLYSKVIAKGIPLVGDETNASNGLQISTVYRNVDGQIINPISISQGTDFKVEVTIRNTSGRSYKEMALHQIFPSGWQIHNPRLDRNLDTGDDSDYQDYRDDRAYIFYDLTAGQTKTFIVHLNASFKGKYYMPTVFSSAMYDDKINARVHGKWVEVQ